MVGVRKEAWRQSDEGLRQDARLREWNRKDRISNAYQDFIWCHQAACVNGASIETKRRSAEKFQKLLFEAGKTEEQVRAAGFLQPSLMEDWKLGVRVPQDRAFAKGLGRFLFP